LKNVVEKNNVFLKRLEKKAKNGMLTGGGIVSTGVFLGIIGFLSANKNPDIAFGAVVLGLGALIAGITNLCCNFSSKRDITKEIKGLEKTVIVIEEADNDKDKEIIILL